MFGNIDQMFERFCVTQFSSFYLQDHITANNHGFFAHLLPTPARFLVNVRAEFTKVS